jgi:hypothetical protein
MEEFGAPNNEMQLALESAIRLVLAKEWDQVQD